MTQGQAKGDMHILEEIKKTKLLHKAANQPENKLSAAGYS